MGRSMYDQSNGWENFRTVNINGLSFGENDPYAVSYRQKQQQAQQPQQPQGGVAGGQTIADFMKIADPFASQRSQYGVRLSDLMGMGGGSGSTAPAATLPAGGQQVTALSGMMRPAATTAGASATTAPAGNGTARLNDVLQSNPFFQANMDAGQEAAKRRLAQMGMGTSGNAALELQKDAQANMSGEYFRMADLLGKFSGANADPASGANAGLQAWRIMEDARQDDNRYAPMGTWQGNQLVGSQKKPPITLGNLSSYWGA